MPTELRMTPTGRTVEVMVPEELSEGDKWHNENAARWGMVAVDSGGRIIQDDPQKELLRLEAKRKQWQMDDEAVAYETAKARRANPRFGFVAGDSNSPLAPAEAYPEPDLLDPEANMSQGWAPVKYREDVIEDPLRGDKNLIIKSNYQDVLRDQKARGLFRPGAQPRWMNLGLDTEDKIDAELFAPIRHRYGVPDPKPENNARLFEMGNTLVQSDPHTGTSRVVYTGPTKTVEEKPVEFITGEDMLGKPHVVKMKPSAFSANFSSFPEFARTNAVNLANMGTNAPGFTPPSMGTNAPAAVRSTSERVRVKGPGGARGTILKGTSLPAGWSLE